MYIRPSRARSICAFAAGLWLLGGPAFAAGPAPPAPPARGVTVRSASAPSGRTALVIGNAHYQRSPLVNTTNDARGVSAALTKDGFNVVLLEDASLEQMSEAITHFGDALTGGDVGVFFFAGHGVQVGGRNYLIPTGVDIQREDEVRFKAVDAEEILAKMQSARNPVNIVILDACRDNPFATRGRSLSTPGFAVMEAPVGALIAFSTQPGAQASDGAGSNGLYTQYLLKYLNEPGLRVEDVFKRVRAGVRSESGGRQIPWESTSLEGDFAFAAATPGSVAGDSTGSAVAEAAPPVDPAVAKELALWEAVEGSTNPRDFELYLERYPNGRHASVAKARALAAAPTGRKAFSFSREDAALAAEQAAHADPWAKALRTSCPGDRQHASVQLDLQSVDPEAAAAAEADLGGRLRTAGWTVRHEGADYRLHASIATQRATNRYLNLFELSASTSLNLSDANGTAVATALARSESLSGGSTDSVQAELLRQSIDEASARLYSDFCAGH